MMIVLSSLCGSMIICYSFGFMVGLLDNYFEIVENLKSGKEMVI